MTFQHFETLCLTQICEAPKKKKKNKKSGTLVTVKVFLDEEQKKRRGTETANQKKTSWRHTSRSYNSNSTVSKHTDNLNKRNIVE